MFRSALAFVICAAFALAPPMAQAQMTDAQKMERNKKNVVEFYNAVLNEKDFEKAKTYVGATYIQHNPIGADGLDGIKGFINFLREKFPNNKSEIKRMKSSDHQIPDNARDTSQQQKPAGPSTAQ